MTRPVIISCALTGGADSAHMNPAIPVTPEQIASEALAARKAGASIVHIHVRDPKTGKPSRDVALYRETVQRIRDAGTEIVQEPTNMPYGVRDCAFRDPAGNLIRLMQAGQPGNR